MKMSKGRLTAVIICSVIIALMIAKMINYSHDPKGAANSFRVKGNPDAPVKIVEFTDFQCPACAKAAGMIDELVKKNPDKIFFELKYFPLKMHSFARQASVYAECAGAQGQFWPLHNVLFKTQESWSKMTSVDSYFAELARSLGADGEKLSACVSSTNAQIVIDKSVEEGQSRGVNSTPTFFVNGKMVVGGPAVVREIEAILGNERQNSK